MASKEAVITRRSINDLLTCLICNQVAVDPRMLPCVHVFCLKCLENHGANESRNPNNQMPCPTCHSQFDIPVAGFSAIQRDLFIDKMKRFNEILTPSACEACSDGGNELATTQLARNFCVQCQQKLCECCSKTHKRSKLYMNHRLFDLKNKEMHNDLAQQLVTVYCDKHKEEHLKLYCSPCKQVLCTTCYIEAHQSHERKSVSDVASQFRELLRAELVRLETPLKKLSEDKNVLDKENEEITRNLDKIMKEISKREEEVKAVVRCHTWLLLHQVKAKGKEKREVNEKTKTEFDARLIRLRSFSRYCEEMIFRGSDIDVCVTAQRIIHGSEELLEEHSTKPVTWQPQAMTLFVKEADMDKFHILTERNIIGYIQDSGEPVRWSTDIEIQELRKRISELEVEINKEKIRNGNIRKMNDKLNQDLKLESGRQAALQTKNKELVEKLQSENLRCNQLISKIFELNTKIERSKNQEVVNCRNKLREQHELTDFLSDRVTDFERKEFKWKVNENKLNEGIRKLGSVFAPEACSRCAWNFGKILYKQRPADADYEQASFSSVIRRKCSTHGNIAGIAVTKGRLIVASEGSSVIEIFNSKTFDFITCFKVQDLVDPVDMKGSSNGFLYIMDRKTINHTKEIIKVNSTDYIHVQTTRWSTGWDSGLLSITKEGNVILTVSDKATLKEYNSNGVLVHEITVNIIKPYVRSADDLIHAVKLNTGHYLVSYKLASNDIQGICVIDEEGRIFKSDQNIAYFPTYMTTDSRGSVVVAENRSGRVIQLDSALDYRRDFISWPDRHTGLLRVHVEDSTEPQLFISYQAFNGESVIRVFNVGSNRAQRWLTAIFKYFDRSLPENTTTRAFVKAIRTWTTSDTAVAIDRAMSRALKVVMFCATLLFLIFLIVLAVKYLR